MSNPPPNFYPKQLNTYARIQVLPVRQCVLHSYGISYSVDWWLLTKV